MATKREITPELIRQLLIYDPETGRLIWAARPAEMFSGGYHPAEHDANIWNQRYAGTNAFTTPCSKGYRRGSIFNKKFLAHRIAWAISYGEWPKGLIDHINGDSSDNRLSNLRDVSQFVNMRNAAMPRSNTTGAVGIMANRAGKRWIARATIEGNLHHIGTFDSIHEAAAARMRYTSNFGFTERHGCPAKTLPM